jgi:hypothetical protein
MDLQEDQSLRIISLAKKYQGIHPARLEKIIDIYHESRMRDYSEFSQYDPKQLHIATYSGTFGIKCMANLSELRSVILQKNQLRWDSFLRLLEEVVALYEETVLVVSMLHLISPLNLTEELREQLVEQLKASYEGLLSLDVK